jgi:hypothetical protein
MKLHTVLYFDLKVWVNNQHWPWKYFENHDICYGFKLCNNLALKWKMGAH